MSDVKFHPGHYLKSNSFFKKPTMDRAIKNLLAVALSPPDWT
jgi:hypothetical protein